MKNVLIPFEDVVQVCDTAWIRVRTSRSVNLLARFSEALRCKLANHVTRKRHS
jgi:hypothetical protein